MASLELTQFGTDVSVVDLRDAAQASVPTVYFVGSEAEKAILERGLSDEGSSASILVIEMGTLSGDFLYNTIVGEQMDVGDFEIVDLRQ